MATFASLVKSKEIFKKKGFEDSKGIFDSIQFNSIKKCFTSSILKSETFIRNNEIGPFLKINYDVKSREQGTVVLWSSLDREVGGLNPGKSMSFCLGTDLT